MQGIIKNINKGNSKERKEERQEFVKKHLPEIRKLVEGFNTTRPEIIAFVEKVVRKEIAYDYKTSNIDIFKFITRTFDGLLSEQKISPTTNNYKIILNIPINEATIEIREEYCKCGRKLKLVEKLCGNLCTEHVNNIKTVFHNGKL